LDFFFSFGPPLHILELRTHVAHCSIYIGERHRYTKTLQLKQGNWSSVTSFSEDTFETGYWRSSQQYFLLLVLLKSTPAS
jgi:hypothetical protein